MTVGPAGGNGQWARARNQQGAKSFLQEMNADAEHMGPGIERSLEMRRKVRRKIRELLHLR